MQNYSRLYTYIHEYQQLVYDYYSKHSIAFLVTYYNLNTEETVWDNENLMGGYYEKLGDLTGVRFNKILLLPIYYIEDVTSSFDGQDIGYIKEGETSIVIPSTYGITPYPNDMVKFEQEYLRPTNDVYPLFQVSGVEIHPNTNRRFWKLRLEVDQSHTTTEADLQVEETYSFVDYDKKIHTLNDSISITRMMSKNSGLKDRLNDLYDENSGFYFI